MSLRLLTAVALAVLVVAAPACGHSAPSTNELIQTLLQSPDREKQVDAARQLAEPVDPAIVRRVLRSAGTSRRARIGVRLLQRRLAAIYDGAPGAAPTRTAAIRAIAVFDDPAAASSVARAVMNDRNEATRTAAASALGRMKQSAPLVVTRLVSYRDARRSTAPSAPQVVRALVAIGLPAVRRLLPLLPEAPWAQKVVARIGKPAVPLLLTRLRQGTFRQKVAASYGLLAMRETQPRAAKAAVPTIVSTMMQKLATNDADDAIQVLARTGGPARIKLVELARKPYTDLSEVEKKQASWTAFALATMANVNPKAAAPLIAALKQRDYDLVADLHDFYIQLGRRGSEPALIAALNAKGDTIMALAFLNSGNQKLDRAARDWAARRGYTVTTSPGTSIPPSWGAGRNL
jgi:hypothetical protein